MALANYSELVSEVEAFLNRADLGARIPTYIALFEAAANRALRVPDMEATAIDVASSETLALPSDYLALREVRVDGKAVPPYAPQDLHDQFRLTNGEVRGYSVLGTSLIFMPAPTAVTVKITYYQKIPALTASNTTNWLLTNHPDAYLFGTLAAAKAHIMDDEQAAKWQGAAEAALEAVQIAGNKKRLPATPLAARLTIAP